MKEVEETLKGYREILERIYNDELCPHCALTRLFGLSVAITYDTLGKEISEKMAKKWDGVEAECKKQATHFLEDIDSI